MFRCGRRLAVSLPKLGVLLGVCGLTLGLVLPVSVHRAAATAADPKPKAIKTAGKPAGKSAGKSPGNSEEAKPDAKTDEKAAVDKPEKSAVPVKLPEKVFSTGYSGSYVDLISFINTQVRAGWQDNNIPPSEVADDGEWIRRVYLDVVGHIPDVDDYEKFVADKDKAKRAKLIDKLLDDPNYVRNFTTIWTNLLIGRTTPQRVSRKGLQKFLRESYGKNRAWSEMVYDLLTAEGHMEENGATNFLMSHLNEGAVPATAISAKLFLGLQVQCTQCHNHPFNEWKQEAFWEFNSFFKQVRRVEHQKYDEKTGRMVFDYSELVPQDFKDAVFFEKRSGLMQVAYPKFNGTDVDPGADTNRRMELAKIITQTKSEKSFLADAMVNRMWGHLFGYGFTKPVDDMGPHNAPSNPVLLDRLSTEFVKAGYDLKQLIRWICNSEAYNLTSRFTPKNQSDNPAAGEAPLFSHLYVKSMNAEQLFDSLIIATNAHKSGRANWEQAETQRQQWMQQFVVAFGTDENDESTTFDGTIPQALMMMNGKLIEDALSGAKGSLLNTVLTDKGKDNDKIKTLYVATLSRTPSQKELTAAKKVLSGAKTPFEAYQDLYWALLNSNEFIFNH